MITYCRAIVIITIILVCLFVEDVLIYSSELYIIHYIDRIKLIN